MRKQTLGFLSVSWSLASFTGHERRYLARHVRQPRPIKPAAPAEAPAA